MFSAKQCTVISWSRDLDVHGVTLNVSGGKLGVTAAAKYAHTEGGTLSYGIQHVYESLTPDKDQQVILTGYVDKGAYLELKLPKLSDPELASLLQFELGHHIPFCIDDLVWCYEVIGDAEHETGKVMVRVYVVPEDIWGGLTSELQLSDIEADLFIPSFMSYLGNEQCYLPSLNRDFALSASNDQFIRSFTISTDVSCEASKCVEDVALNEFASVINSGAFTPALLCGVYVLKNHVKLHNSSMELPEDMRPQRFRFVRNIFFASAAVAAVFAASFVYRIYEGNSSRLQTLQDELLLVQNRQGKLKRSILKGTDLESKIDTLNKEYYGEHNLLGHLVSLTRQLPNQMRLSSLTLRNGEINLTIVTSKYSESAMRSLQNDPSFDVASVKKRTFRGETSVDVKLRIRSNSL